MRPSAVVALLLSLAASVSGLYESQAGIIDWHKPYIGIPKLTRWTSPRFHQVVSTKPSVPSKAVVIVGTQKNIIAALNPSDGAVVWRRQYEEDDPLVAFRGNADGLVTVSGHGGATARIYEAVNGNLIWEAHFHKSATGHLEDPGTLGVAIAFDNIDILVLSNGHTVRKLAARDGAVIWGWTSPDQASTTIFTKIVRSSTALYVIGITKSFRSYTLNVVSLNPENGEVIETVNVPSDLADLDNYRVLLGTSRGPTTLVWLEGESVKTVALTADLSQIKKATSTKYGPYDRVLDLGVEELGYLAAIKKNGEADIYRIDRDGLGMNKVVSLDSSGQAAEYDIFSGGVDRKGNPYISKIGHSPSLKQAMYQLLAPTGADGGPLTTGFTFQYDMATHGPIVHAAMDVANTAEYTYFSRIILTTQSGSIQQWKQEQNIWTREESLTEVIVADVVELPEGTVSQTVLEDRTDTFFERLSRQIGDLQGLPMYLFHFIQRFFTGQHAITTLTPTTDSEGALWRDPHGFKKLVVLATSTGKIFGVETQRGDIVWNFKLANPTVTFRPLKLSIIKTVTERFHPEVALVGAISTSQGAYTAVLHIDAITGKAQPVVTLFEGQAKDAFEVDVGKKVLAVIDQGNKVHVYPVTEDYVQAFSEGLPHMHYALQAGSPQGQYLEGYSLLPTYSDGPFGGRMWASYLTWRSTLKPGETVVSVTRRPQLPVASPGKVLGDRSTMYKYLNPHLLAVVTATASPEVRCTVHLIDSVKGTILYSSAMHIAKKGRCDLKVSIVENWLVYHYWDDGHAGGLGHGLPGWRIASVELYDGTPDVKRKSEELTGLDAQRANFTAIEQSWVFPSDVKAMVTTNTKFGISLKDLVVVTPKHQVQTFGRRYLDPRRPKSKPTPQEVEEMLAQYDPLLPDDPRRIVSHNYDVIAENLLTTSTSLESTSLILAYGHDLFLTRVTPSGTFDALNPNFNKIQLVLTVGGLAAAILIARPLVRSRDLKKRWQY